MRSFTLPVILLSLILFVVSAPLPNPQNPVGPITFGDLTTPSQGGTFDDFKAGEGLDSTEGAPASAAPVARRRLVSRSRPDASLPEDTIYPKRGVFPSFDAALHFGHDGCDSGGGKDCFEAAVPAKDKPAKAKAPATQGKATPAKGAAKANTPGKAKGH